MEILDKFGWVSKYIIWVGVFLAPVKAVMIAVSFLVATDLIVGIWAAVKRGDRITSAKLSRTVSKSFGYQMAVVTAFVTETYLLPELPIVKVIAGFIAMTEILSVMEGLGYITGVPLHEVVSKLLNKSDSGKP